MQDSFKIQKSVRFFFTSYVFQVIIVKTEINSVSRLSKIFLKFCKQVEMLFITKCK